MNWYECMAKSVSFNLQKFMQDGEIDRLKTQIEKDFKMEEGPFIKGLDQALKSFHVQREAYYGGTFIGNHIHKCLKVKYFTL